MPRHFRSHSEIHRAHRAGWLRAAVLGADDAVVSVASLMIGVSASSASKAAVLVAGAAGLVAGAMSMGAGEYVSVSSQRDAELADIEVEKRELASAAPAELKELAGIYVKRGLDEDLAMKVAKQLTRRDPLAAHLRDELGLDPASLARPVQAALISAASFGTFGLVPLVGLSLAPSMLAIPVIAGLSLLSLAALGALGGRLGGAPVVRAAVRVTLGGALAIIVTGAIGRLFGIVAAG